MLLWKQEIFWLFDVERRKKTEDVWNVFFKALAKIFLLTLKSSSWPTFYQMDFMKRYWYVMLLCYVTKSRLDVQFVKKIPLEMVIGQQMKEEGYDQNNGFYIKLSIHLLLK